MTLTDQERAAFEAKAINSGVVCDAMDALGIPRGVATGFMLLGKPGARFVGPAVTLKQVPKDAGDDREARMTKHRVISRELAQKGDVVVIDNGGRVDFATWGELHGLACRQRGIAGVVIDGSTRDGPEIRDSGLPTFVRGLTPGTSKRDLKTASINEPVMLGGVKVCPGDIIYADETGVVIVPQAYKAQVVAKVNEIRKAEEIERAKVS